MEEVFIVSCARTPIGKFGGSLKSVSAAKLGAIAMEGAVQRIGNREIIEQINEVIMGNVLQAGAGQAPARQAALFAGLPDKVKTITIRKECASSLAAIDFAHSRIKAGEAQIIIAGGMESMSQSPYLLRRYFIEGEKNFGHRDGNMLFAEKQLMDSMLWDGLQDVYEDTHPHMGELVEAVAKRYKVSRYDQDLFAILSFERANRAMRDGNFEKEIAPVRKLLSKDEGIRETSVRKLFSLKPVFIEAGTITAGNASQLSDGAAALVLMSEDYAQELDIQPMARVVACAGYALAPAKFPLAPIGAIKEVLGKANLSVSDIDFFEINEAFAPVPIIASRELKIPMDRLNVRGGAIALGHPLAASGARILTTLLYIMQDHQAQYGIVSACNGGGEAVAVLIENLQRPVS